jgi:hypothetical protein
VKISGMGIPVISTLAGITVGFLSTAASAGLATAAVDALSAALSLIGLTQLVVVISAIIVAAGVLAGVLSNTASVSKGVSTTVSLLKGALMALFDFLLAIGVPVWNLFLDILEVGFAVISPIAQALTKLGRGLGLISEGGSAAGGALSFLRDVFVGIGEAIGFIFKIFQGPFNLLADVIYATLFIPLMASVEALLYIVDVVGSLINAFKKLPLVSTILDGINEGIDKIGDGISLIQDSFSKAITMMIEGIENMVNNFVSELNFAIEVFNALTPDMFNIDNRVSEVDLGESGGAAGAFSSFDASTREAKNNAAELAEDDNKSARRNQVPATRQTVNNTYKTENNFEGDFNMKPEEKARVKGLIREAINEANREKRLRDGGN